MLFRSSATATGSVPAPVSTNVMPALGTVTVGGVALTSCQLPPHTHPYCGLSTSGPSNHANQSGGYNFYGVAKGSGCSTQPAGSCSVATHTHATTGLTTAALGSFSGSTTSLAIQYLDNIIAQYQK